MQELYFKVDFAFWEICGTAVTKVVKFDTMLDFYPNPVYDCLDRDVVALHNFV